MVVKNIIVEDMPFTKSIFEQFWRSYCRKTIFIVFHFLKFLPICVFNNVRYIGADEAWIHVRRHLGHAPFFSIPRQVEWQIFLFLTCVAPTQVWEAVQGASHRGHGLQVQEDDRHLQGRDGEDRQVEDFFFFFCELLSRLFKRQQKRCPLPRNYPASSGDKYSLLTSS